MCHILTKSNIIIFAINKHRSNNLKEACDFRIYSTLFNSKSICKNNLDHFFQTSCNWHGGMSDTRSTGRAGTRCQTAVDAGTPLPSSSPCFGSPSTRTSWSGWLLLLVRQTQAISKYFVKYYFILSCLLLNDHILITITLSEQILSSSRDPCKNIRPRKYCTVTYHQVPTRGMTSSSDMDTANSSQCILSNVNCLQALLWASRTPSWDWRS